MAIDPNSLMLRLNPMRPLSLAPLQQAIGGADRSLERERLRLMREQFEESRRQHQEQAALAKLEEAGRTTRAKMQAEAEAEAQRQKQQAELMQRRQEAVAKFGELNAGGDIEGARAMVPFLDSLGVGVSLEGEEAGLPRYRVETDPEATAKAELDARNAAGAAGDELGAAGVGYPTDDSGVLDEPAGIPSTEEAFARAQGASKFAEMAGMPWRAPGAADLTGGVPKNVIDMGALQAQTQARLDPALGGLIGAYPEQYRDSAAQTAAATRGLGLPASKAIDTFDKLRGGPDSLIQAGIAADAQQGRFAEGQEKKDVKEAEILYNRGFNYGKEAAAKYNVEDLITARDQTKNAVNLLTNEDDTDDHLVLALISRRMGERGATTEGDIKRVTGMSAMSWLDQAKTWLERGVQGGLSLQQRNAMVSVLKAMEESDTKRFQTYLDKLDSESSMGDTNPDVARGMRAYSRLVVPSDVLKARQPKKTAGADATSGASPIPETARIARVHNNPGNLKFADQQGAEKGEAASDGGSWAKFKTYEDGLAALRKQIEKDAGRGLTVRQFVSKYAPPKSNDTDQYVADAVAALGVSEDAKMSDIDIEDAVAFVAKKESGTDVGVADSTDDDAEARALEILERGGY